MVFHVHQEVFKMSLFVFMSRLASYIESNVMPQVYKNIPCITIAESAKKEMKEMGLGAAGITVINPGISLEEYIPGKKAKEPTILFVGRLKQYKSIQTVLYAFKKVLESVTEARCIIAGDGEERKRLKKLSVKLGIADSISFTAKVSEKKKIQLYQQAWLVMNPSVKEGWGITSLEANACGTPVVASNVAGLKDSVKNGYSGLLVKYGDSNAFAEAALHLIKNSEDRTKMSTNAVTWAKQFPWEKTVKELEALLN
jgi:glycosyltransferase involved in cell wall biosynthesis